LVAQKSGQHILLDPSWLHEQAAAGLRCKRLLELLKPSDPESVTCFGLDMFLAHRPGANGLGTPRQARLPDMRQWPTHQQLVDPLDARVGSLHPRDERSSHLEFGWSRPHGANRRWHF